MQIDLTQYLATQFSNYLNDTVSIGNQDIEYFENLVSQYPYCQILHTLAAKAALGTPNFDEKLESAAIYVSSREILYTFINLGEEHLGNNSRAVGDPINENYFALADENPVETEAKSSQSEKIIENLVETEISSSGFEVDNDEVLEEITEENIFALADENPVETEAKSSQSEVESPKLVAIFPQIETYDHHDSILIKDIEEEAISAINNYSLTTDNTIPTNLSPQPEGKVENIVQLEARNPLPKPESSMPDAEPIALYNDEKLPFTFLWWLNKTRKEHYENNQPYANLQPITPEFKPQTGSELLNHQIAENILHLGALDKYKDDKQNTEAITEEDKIIKKFIKEEPQIKPLPANKIDTENKAKLSSADAGELVSETLAKIYVEQMLYAKALETYKKLSLKYPEKSTYFASQIKYLELKVN